MNSCHLVHGFNVSDGGKGTTDKLTLTVKRLGYNPSQADYGWLGILGVIFRNDNIAEKIAKHVKAGDIGIGHSNGCAILAKAAQQGAPFNKLILINPALDKDYKFPEQIKEIHVIHSKHDKPVVTAMWLRKSTHFIRKVLPFDTDFQWGEMGNTGFTGKDSRVSNHDVSKWAKGHSAVFKRENMHRLIGLIRKVVLS